MTDKKLNRFSVIMALVFMVCELTYINTKSLLYLTGHIGEIDKYFSIIGSLAFSMVTVVVMRNKNTRQFMKIAFPVFDTLLVLCGFNLQHAEAIINGTDNPVRLWLTVFMALFTGLITYSLGIIHFDEITEKTSARDQLRINELITRKHEVELKLDELRRKEYESDSIIDDLKTNQIESKRIIDELKSKLNDSNINAQCFLLNHIRYESFVSKKKSDSNRNRYETAMIELANKIKAGESISYEQYKKAIS